VIVRRVAEQLMPSLPRFAYNPIDARFPGSPVDLVVFDGLDAGELRRIVFVEVKTATATLTSCERRVRDAIRHGCVEREELRVGCDPAAARDGAGSQRR
jgi:predicted Holliday junction resolvase-like endonuclease